MKPAVVLCLLSFVLPLVALADQTINVEVDGSEKTLAVSTSYSSRVYWGVSKTDPSGVIKSVSTTKTSSSSKSTSTSIVLTGKDGTANVTVFSSSRKNPTSGTVRNTITVVATSPRTAIDVPAAATGLVFDNAPKTGVAAGDHYARGGTYEATAAGNYTATVTPEDGHCWPDGTYGEKTIAWSIARRKATVTVVSTNKVVGATFDGGYADPLFTTTIDNLIDGDTSTLTWDIFRTNACEEVGTYDLLIEGAAQQGSYDLVFVGGSYSIMEEPLKPGFLLMLK